MRGHIGHRNPRYCCRSTQQGCQNRLVVVMKCPLKPRGDIQTNSRAHTTYGIHGAVFATGGLGSSVIQRRRGMSTLVTAAEREENGPNPQALFDSDDTMRAFGEHFDYRIEQYTKTLMNIEMYEKSLENFAMGYTRFGFIKQKDCIVYREWAPGAIGAQLIGDFNNWNGVDMTRDDFGVWSVTIPDRDGQPGIPHGSRVKIRLQHPGGWWLDRLPAWIRWATVEPNKMGAKYDGIYWDPPTGEKHVWKHARPEFKENESLKIYEAHVGMSSEKEDVASYRYFADHVIPRIKEGGYNAVQLMAIQEHAYYASFGYHVTNPFAVSSRSGTPEDLKYLVDTAHKHGIHVLLDIVHSHISSNADDGLAGYDFGQGLGQNYFLQGDAGYHRQWDSRLLDYNCYETLRYLLSNVRYWLEEYNFDGFRFDGVTSMLYHHHGIDVGFSGNYNEYFSMSTNIDAIVYLMLANKLIHDLVPSSITIAEDVSGMPGLCRSVSDGGVGFDYRLGMGLPDFWIRLLKHVKDEDWKMSELVSTLCNRRYSEKTVGYAESHDQALVGDQTIAFRLMGADMYEGMSSLSAPSEIISRGMALHKMIRLITMALGGEAYLNFMGNEFGHPEWIDFPREGNDWSYHHCRRQWNLVDSGHLRYSELHQFDKSCMELDQKYPFIASPIQWVTMLDDDRQILVAERGSLVFVFNFNPFESFEGLKIPVPVPGKYRVVLDNDEPSQRRVGWGVDHFSDNKDLASSLPRNEYNREQYIHVLAPSRSVVVYHRVEDEDDTKLQKKVLVSKETEES